MYVIIILIIVVNLPKTQIGCAISFFHLTYVKHLITSRYTCNIYHQVAVNKLFRCIRYLKNL